MSQPLFTINKGAISGVIWDGKYGPQPSFRKAKRNKEGKFEKDENGKQVYTDFYNMNDLKDIEFVVHELHHWMVFNPQDKKEEF
jgi:hypothetical protein